MHEETMKYIFCFIITTHLTILINLDDRFIVQPSAEKTVARSLEPLPQISFASTCLSFAQSCFCLMN